MRGTKLSAGWIACFALLVGPCDLAGAKEVISEGGYSANVAKAVCGPADRPESGLQGQIPLSERKAGFKGANCNLSLVTNLPMTVPDGALRMFTITHDRAGNLCGFATGSSGSVGTTVVDMTDPKQIIETATLTTPAMLRAIEALKANETRGLLVSTSYVLTNTATTDPADRTLDVYDIGTDCRHPRLLASARLSFDTSTRKTGFHGFKWPNPDYVMGHEGNFAPDGLTFYVADGNHGVYHAIDLTNPAKPQLLDSFMSPTWTGYGDGPGDDFQALQSMPHSLSVSINGNRGYFSDQAADSRYNVIPRTGPWQNGFMVVDTSEIQSRKPGGKMRIISQVSMRDGGGHHGPNFIRIKGRPYIIDNDEFGAGQLSVKGRIAACRAGLPPNGMVRIWDMKDEKNPRLVSKLVLEVNDPKNCAAVEPETAAGAAPWVFLYDPHQCGVDNREDTTTLVCGYWQSGIRVYDIRDPAHVKEIAYFVPPASTSGEISSCPGIPRLDAKSGMIYEFCSGSGFMALKFRDGVWPFDRSTTPPDRQL